MDIIEYSGTRPENLAKYLKRHGKVTPIRAQAELDEFRLSATVKKLRTTHKHLLPEGKGILTVDRVADSGVQYGEYRLVKAAEATW